MGDVLQQIKDRVTAFRAWGMERGFVSARLVQYCGDECVGGIDLPPEAAEQEIRGCLGDGFRVEWEQSGQRLYICVLERIDGPLDWQKVFSEEHFSDIDAILKRARILNESENEDKP